ncbi:hypothetical protein EXU30_17630 [Shewanella maritima]|uniref:Uncharacterized protein n=1 Tax=Shewanella maritima TaxID=2520507 RepID=A0A411PL82_9GAMM|nr:hypothetical protein [Shewanella maritima]QBF84290.1 hypothetical protein EXU30_17630 [Shewanella maritima]
MKLFKSTAKYQQAFTSKHNDVTAFHAAPIDISLMDYAEMFWFKLPALVFGRTYYRLQRHFDKGPSKDLDADSLYQLIATTGLARYVRGDELDLAYFANINMPSALIKLDHKSHRAMPVAADNESEAQTMDRAQRACFLAVPIHYHSFVHFHAPTAMAVYAATLPKSHFKHFLQRHSRYTLVYNNGGIDLASSSYMCQTLLPDYTNHRASDSILARVQQYWNITKQTKPELPLAREIANPENFVMDWHVEAKGGLPFEQKIRRFYGPIRDYVLKQNFSEQELQAFSDWFSEHIYPIPEELRATAVPLTYLVWSNSVVHSLEHAEYYKWKAYARYGSQSHDESWYRYFMNAFTKPYGSYFRDEKLQRYVPEIKGIEGAGDCYVSIQF